MSWEWARIKCRKGRPIEDADAWIAAAALLYELPVVTHNPRHFQHIEGLKVLTVSS
jgi:tRNA(fMet)-specific endonuclease VapC